MTFEFELDQMKIKGLNQALDEGVEVALTLAAEHVLTVSNQHVPHDEGTLERSGKTSYDPKKKTAAVSYNTPYARRQHEELTWKHENGRTAKYLENAMNSERRNVLKIIRQTLGLS